MGDLSRPPRSWLQDSLLTLPHSLALPLDGEFPLQVLIKDRTRHPLAQNLSMTARGLLRMVGSQSGTPDPAVGGFSEEEIRKLES